MQHRDVPTVVPLVFALTFSNAAVEEKRDESTKTIFVMIIMIQKKTK
jgi:hypothetical protein